MHAWSAGPVTNSEESAATRGVTAETDPLQAASGGHAWARPEYSEANLLLVSISALLAAYWCTGVKRQPWRRHRDPYPASPQWNCVLRKNTPPERDVTIFEQNFGLYIRMADCDILAVYFFQFWVQRAYFGMDKNIYADSYSGLCFMPTFLFSCHFYTGVSKLELNEK